MKRFCSKVLFAALVIAAGAAAPAGEPPSPLDADEAALAAKVTELLGSEKAADRAWGAYYAGKHRVAAAAPALLGILSKPADRKDKRAVAVECLAESALIDIGPDLDDEQLDRIIGDRRYTLALALIAPRAKERIDLLRRMLGAEGGEARLGEEAWIAVCNMLMDARAVGLALRFIGETRVKVRIGVWDPGAGGGVSGATMICSDGGVSAGDDFPPLVVYELALGPRPGDRVLARGPSVVYLRRNESTRRGSIGTGSVGSPLDRDEYRLKCLTEMVRRTPEEMELDVRPSIHVSWEGPDTMRRDVADGAKKIVDAWRALARELNEKKLLDDASAETVLPAMAFEVEDKRKDKAEKLPPVDDLLPRQENAAPEAEVF